MIKQLESDLEVMQRDFTEQLRQQEEEYESEMVLEQGMLVSLWFRGACRV